MSLQFCKHLWFSSVLLWNYKTQNTVIVAVIYSRGRLSRSGNRYAFLLFTFRRDLVPLPKTNYSSLSVNVSKNLVCFVRIKQIIKISSSQLNHLIRFVLWSRKFISIRWTINIFFFFYIFENILKKRKLSKPIITSNKVLILLTLSGCILNVVNCKKFLNMSNSR